MKFMIKSFLIFLLAASFSSCGVIKVAEYADLVGTIAFGATDIIVDQEFYDAQAFSFAKISLGRNKTAIVTLGIIDGETLQWFSSSKSGIYTQNGKITSLIDFSNDVDIASAKKIQFNKTKSQKNLINVSLKDPDGFFLQDADLKFKTSEEIEYFQKTLKADLYIETITTQGLRWNYENKYWINPSTGLVIKSEQTVHPRLPRITISYYYKYLD